MPVTLVKTKWSSGNLQFLASDGTVIATFDGTNKLLTVVAAPLVATYTTTQALTAALSGQLSILNATVSFVVTLPAANAAGAGVSLSYEFTHLLATTSGVGNIIRPAGSDTMSGTVITTPAAAKGLMNTQATSHIGDSATIMSDGVSQWYVVSTTGTWTREA